MALILGKTYRALLSAGATEEEAQAAAEELADDETRIASIDSRLGRIETEIKVLHTEMRVITRAVGINVAATIAILGALLHGVR
jgi:hypothetical protein